MLKTTRAEAKTAGDRHYFTGKPCKNGHTENRLTSTGGCLACYRVLHADLKDRDPKYKARQDAARDLWAASDRGKKMTAHSRESRREIIRAQKRARSKTESYRSIRADYYHRVVKKCPQYKVRHNIATRVRGLLMGTSRGQSATKIERLCGYKISELRAHLERQFLAGMSWDNYGVNGWHIDHIVPAAQFDMLDDKQFAACWSLGNLRPLWGKDNSIKGKKAIFLL